LTRSPRRIRRSRIAIAGLAALALAVVVAPVAEAAKAPPKGQVRVMSRNLYLGADLGPALEADDTTELALAAAAIQQQVDHTDFPRRSKLLAAEIKKKNPDLVGLQEVALWRNDCQDIVFPCDSADDIDLPAQDGPLTPAKTVRYDFLAQLLKKLNKGKGGPDYKAVDIQEEADIEAPLATGGDGRLTMRDVILARKDDKVKTEFPASRRFENNIVQLVGGVLPVTFWRGWQRVEATVRGERFRFVNTHLEAFDFDVREAQAGELIATLPEIGPANATEGAGKPVVLAGDLNTDDEIVETLGNTPGHVEDEEPYAVLTTDPDGADPRVPFEERSFDGPGFPDPLYSCCYPTDTIDNPADVFDHTVDHIMVSDDDPGGSPTAPTDPNTNDIVLVDSDLTGENVGGAADQSDMTGGTPSLFPSDHGGVVSTLQFP
jgi:endonuclease/exonuclease/phosphatase family metal-dependent hydrolase